MVIYRIAIHKDGKFDHYASDDEMEYLKVGANGNVYAMRHYEKELECNIYDVFLDWLDVSDTHKVELGIDYGEKCYFENDIVAIILYDAIDGDRDKVIIGVIEYDRKDKYSAFGFYVREKGVLYPLIFSNPVSHSEHLGNVHHNPELLEVK